MTCHPTDSYSLVSSMDPGSIRHHTHTMWVSLQAVPDRWDVFEATHLGWDGGWRPDVDGFFITGTSYWGSQEARIGAWRAMLPSKVWVAIYGVKYIYIYWYIYMYIHTLYISLYIDILYTYILHHTTMLQYINDMNIHADFLWRYPPKQHIYKPHLQAGIVTDWMMDRCSTGCWTVQTLSTT